MNYFIKQFGNPKGSIGRFLGKMMKYSNKKMHKGVLSEINNPGRILEIGFGSGSQLEMIYRHYPESELYGIEISEEMITMAEKTLEGKARLSLYDCCVMEFENGFFDMVITTDSCYFWSEPVNVLKEIKRILKPSGRLVLAYNSMYAKFVHAFDNSKSFR